MKKILFVLAALILGMSVSSAHSTQVAENSKKANVVTVKFATNLDCENCAKKILNVIPFKRGVKDCVVDVPTKTVEVTFDTRKTSEEKLIEELRKIDVLVVTPECQSGACVGEHTKTDACCDGHNHNHSHSHSH